MSRARGKPSAAPPPPWRAVLSRVRLELTLVAIVAVLFGDYLFSDRLLFGTDSIPGGLFFRGLLVDFVRTFHELPRWNPFILGGLPFLDATHGDTFFPSSILHFLMPVYRGLGHKLVLHVVLAGVFMGFYLRTLSLRPVAVWWGAVAYMLSPVLVSYIYAGQDGKIYVTSLAPLVLGLLERAMRGGGVRGFALFGLALGFTILSAQIQMAYHLTWILGALFVLRLVRPEHADGRSVPPRWRTSALFVLAVLVGLGVSAIQLVPAVAYVKDPAGFSVRSDRTDYEHATSWCLHPEEAASIIVPEFCNSPEGYWGRNPFKINSDAPGILVLFLAALALRRRDPTRIFLAGTAVFCVLYALGEHTPIHRICYAIVPQVKLFRAPPLLMFGAAFALVGLAAHGLHDLDVARKGGVVRSPLLAWGLGMAGVLGLVAMGASPLTEFWNGLMRPDLDPALRQVQLANLGSFRAGAAAAALVVGLGAVILHAGVRGRIAWRLAMMGLVLLTIIDLWRIDRRFIVVTDPRPFIEASPLLQRLQAEGAAEPFRVMPIARGLQENQIGYFGIESVLGFHDNELRWYREMRTEPAAAGFLAESPGGFPFLRVLNVKYILHDQPGQPNPYPVPGFLPRFRVVEEWEIAGTPRAIAERMVAADFDPGRTVLLEESPGLPSPPGGDEPAGAVLGWQHDGNEVHVDVDVKRPSLLVQSDNWFPYWHCVQADGTELPILRAYGTLRAVPLDPGRHALTFRFRSSPYRAGRAITLTTLVCVLSAVTIASLRRTNGPR